MCYCTEQEGLHRASASICIYDLQLEFQASLNDTPPSLQGSLAALLSSGFVYILFYCSALCCQPRLLLPHPFFLMQRSVLSRVRRAASTSRINPTFPPARQSIRSRPYIIDTSRHHRAYSMGSRDAYKLPLNAWPQRPPGLSTTPSFDFVYPPPSGAPTGYHSKQAAPAPTTMPNAAPVSGLPAPAPATIAAPKLEHASDGGPDTSSLKKQDSKYTDNNWSPFDSPLVQQCVAGGFQQPPSLLESFNHNIPMYTPTQSVSNSRNNSRPVSPQFTTYAAPVVPPEQVTVRILDMESGEYLEPLPSSTLYR